MASPPEIKTPVPREISVKQLRDDLKSEVGRWRELAFQLRVDRKKIENHSHKSPSSCFSEVIELWLAEDESGANRNRKWKEIYKALQDSYSRLASELEEKYPADSNIELDALGLVELLSEVIPKWFDFGISIGIDYHELEQIKADKGNESCFIEVLQTWLNRKDCYWEQLVKALKAPGIRNNRLANIIGEKYIQVIKDPVSEPTVELWYANIDDTLLNENDHYLDVLKEINAVKRWDNLGLLLGISNSKIEEIKDDNRTMENCRKQMLSEWFRNHPNKREPSWHRLCLALVDDIVGETTLARNIAKRHMKTCFSTAELEEGTTTVTSNKIQFDTNTSEPLSEVDNAVPGSLVAPNNEYNGHNVIDTTSNYPQDAVTDTHDK